MQIFYHLLCSFAKIALITGVTVHQKKTIVHRNLHGLYIHNWLSGKGMIYVATFQAGKLSPKEKGNKFSISQFSSSSYMCLA